MAAYVIGFLVRRGKMEKLEGKEALPNVVGDGV